MINSTTITLSQWRVVVGAKSEYLFTPPGATPDEAMAIAVAIFGRSAVSQLKEEGDFEQLVTSALLHIADEDNCAECGQYLCEEHEAVMKTDYLGWWLLAGKANAYTSRFMPQDYEYRLGIAGDIIALEALDEIHFAEVQGREAIACHRDPNGIPDNHSSITETR